MSSIAPKVLLAGAGVALETQLRTELANQAEVVGSSEDHDDAREAIRRGQCDIAILYIDGDPDAAFRLLGWIVSDQPRVVTIALAKKKDPDWILKAMRGGARQFAVLDQGLTDLKRVLGELAAPAAVTPGAPQSGRVISVFGSKGGTGATTVAVNLAGALASMQRRVVLVDLDLELGDVPVFLDIRPSYTLVDVLGNMSRLDKELLARTLPRHSSSVQVLSQADRMEEGEQVKPPAVTTVLRFLRQHYDDVIVDGLRGFNEISLAAMDESDRILLLLTQDVPAVRNAQRALVVFNRLGYSPDRVQLVVNRWQKNARIRTEDVTLTLGREVNLTVSNDYPTVINCIDEGKLLAQLAARTKVAEDILDMAKFLVGGQKKRAGWLRGLVGRSARAG
jgi:pilus assembly protein CpaE